MYYLFVEIETEGGVGMLPSIDLPNQGDRSKGCRIVSEEIKGKQFIAEVSGLSDTIYEVQLFHNVKLTNLPLLNFSTAGCFRHFTKGSIITDENNTKSSAAHLARLALLHQGTQCVVFYAGRMKYRFDFCII